MKLKEMLHTLFDIDLPISGSNSQSIDTPIIIDKDEPSDYVGTQYAVIMKYKTRKNQLFTLLSIVTLTLTMASCTNSNKDNDWKGYNLSGKVKTLKETTYEAEEKFGKIEKGKIRKYSNNQIQQIKFNKKGYRTEINSYESDGELKEKYIFEYDNKDNKSEQKIYDSDGSLRFKYLYKYDKKGILIEESIYNSDGSLFYKFLFEYDKNKKLRGMNSYDSDGELQEKYVFEYDKKRCKSEQKTYDSDGSLKYKFFHKYDKKRNLTETTIVDKLDQKYEYKYEYEFDKKGNWINRIEFKNNIPNEITEREIEYFD